MSIARAGRSARAHVRFQDAVPLRRDRRDLRRRLRRTARAVRAEQKAELTALLQQLAVNRIPLAEVIPGPLDRDWGLEFGSGTQLLLVTRRGGAGLKRLRASRLPVWLVRAQPSFARRRFRLWFASPDDAALVELVAAVHLVPVLA